MSVTDDVLVNRQLLSSIRMRFSPEVQDIKENVIDNMVERILASGQRDKYFAAKDTQVTLIDKLGFHAIGRDIDKSLERLENKGRVELEPEISSGKKLKEKGPKKKRYKLSDNTRKEIDSIEAESIRRYESVINRLFEELGTDSNKYIEPFLKFLSVIFSKLADEYIQVIQGELRESELVSSPIFLSALNTIKNDIDVTERSVFESAAINFFSSNDPDYAIIKWNMAQNYYSLKVIGLDEKSLRLFKNIFGDAEFYIDTNVVISALSPEESYHKSLIALCNACKKMGIKVKVCKITLDELDNTVNAHIDMLAKVFNQIPEGTAVKVHSDFFEVYYERKKMGDEPDLNDIFANFLSPEIPLQDNFNIELIDESWFEEAKNKDIIGFATIVGERFKNMSKRKKTESACIHDANCLYWIDECRKRDNNKNIWFVTRDHTLPGLVPEGCSYKSLSIGLDALLQWISPFALQDNEEEEMAIAYSHMISSRLLPQERIFNLEDFLIFHELNMSCKELPAEDVEGCIRQIKVDAPLLNPANPVDREKLAHIVASYFADPSRKYKENLQLYESQISDMNGKLVDERNASLKKDAWIRIYHIVFLLILVEILTATITSIYGDGENTFQRVVNSWPIFVAWIPICMVIGWFYLGKHMLRALGWPITKIFKEE